MSSQIIPLKSRTDLRDRAEFWPRRLFAFELRRRDTRLGLRTPGQEQARMQSCLRSKSRHSSKPRGNLVRSLRNAFGQAWQPPLARWRTLLQQARHRGLRAPAPRRGENRPIVFLRPSGRQVVGTQRSSGKCSSTLSPGKVARQALKMTTQRVLTPPRYIQVLRDAPLIGSSSLRRRTQKYQITARSIAKQMMCERVRHHSA